MDGIEKIAGSKPIGLKNLRGKGLMIGFDVEDELSDLRKDLLQRHKIFTGAAKPNVIRLLPSLALTQSDADQFLNALKEEVELVSKNKDVSASVNA
jgi:acetylornithine aminotransferase